MDPNQAPPPEKALTYADVCRSRAYAYDAQAVAFLMAERAEEIARAAGFGPGIAQTVHNLSLAESYGGMAARSREDADRWERAEIERAAAADRIRDAELDP